MELERNHNSLLRITRHVFPSEAEARRCLKEAADGGGVVDRLLPPSFTPNADGSVTALIASKEPPTRDDAKDVGSRLEHELKRRQAREGGLCEIRQQLHWSAFDEIVRQVALGSPERAVLLQRARDQLSITISAYRTLHESSVSFGIKKQLEAEAGMPELERAVADLSMRKQTLEARAAALRARMDGIEKKASERRGTSERKRAEELAFLRSQAKHLEGFLQALPR